MPTDDQYADSISTHVATGKSDYTCVSRCGIQSGAVELMWGHHYSTLTDRVFRQHDLSSVITLLIALICFSLAGAPADISINESVVKVNTLRNHEFRQKISR